MGASLATPSQSPEFFEYFLNPANHSKNTPLDYISYHFYAMPTPDETPETQQYTFFAQADGFSECGPLHRNDPQTLVPANENNDQRSGIDFRGGANQLAPGDEKQDPIPDSYWNLSGALYAYLFGRLTDGHRCRGGIATGRLSNAVSQRDDARLESPATQRALLGAETVRENFGPGDTLVAIRTRFPTSIRWP